jgi:hypothetical protein
LEAFAYEYSEENQSEGWNPIGADKKNISLVPNGLEISSKDGQIFSIM